MGPSPASRPVAESAAPAAAAPVAGRADVAPPVEPAVEPAVEQPSAPVAEASPAPLAVSAPPVVVSSAEARPSSPLAAEPVAAAVAEPVAEPVAQQTAQASAQSSGGEPRFDGRRTDPEMMQLSQDFFSAPPSHPPVDTWVDDYKPAVDKGRKRAMHATLGIVAVSVLGIGSFLIYNKVIMPTPVALGGASAYDMPVPMMNNAPEPVRVPAPEEAARLRAHNPTAMAAPKPGVAPLPSPDGAQPALDSALDPAAEAQPPVPDALTPHVDEAVPTTTDTVTAAPPAESYAADDGYEQLLAEGVKLARKGRSKDALRVLEQARGLRPSGGHVLSELAFLHLNKGRNEEAGELAGRAVAVDPTISMAWIVLGAARDAKRDKSGAKAAYAQCAALPIDEYVRECRRLAR